MPTTWLLKAGIDPGLIWSGVLIQLFEYACEFPFDFAETQP